MNAVIFILIFALLFIIIGTLLFFGKCSWLIAGFNTASAEEKAKYDKKKLCKTTSITCMVVAFMLCIMAYLGYRVESGTMEEDSMLVFAIVFIAVVFTTLIWDIYYSNKNCKK